MLALARIGFTLEDLLSIKDRLYRHRLHRRQVGGMPRRAISSAGTGF